MTTDYYPAASPRGKRSLQSENSAESIEESVVNNGVTQVNTFTAGETLNARYLSENMYVLKKVKNSQNDFSGCCFFKNGADLSLSEAAFSKLGYFSNTSDKKSLIRMGSYLCAFPDGVIFETENTEDELPIFKIESEKTINNFFIRTVVKNNAGKYLDLYDYYYPYTVEDNGVLEHLSDQQLWVDKQTYIKISALSSAKAFDEFRAGDSVELTTKGASDLSVEVEGSVLFKINEEYKNPSTFTILDKGSETVHGFNLDYIVINGFLKYGSSLPFKSYLNSSDFETDATHFPKYATGASQIKIRRKCPEISFACESQNRVWGCSKDGHEIYASALGNPYSFYNYSGLSTDSYAVSLGTDGEFTGCVNYLGKPLFFKENALHVINGSYPSNGGTLDGMSYSVSTTTDFKGVEKGSENSLAIIDNILYYKSSAGIIAFDGINTVVISDKLGKERFKNAVAGAYKNKYYVSMQDSGGLFHLFVYDTEKGSWCKEDNTQVLQFISVNNSLLYIDAESRKIFSLSDEDALGSDDYEKEDSFEWECETGNYGYSYPNNKYLSRFQLRLQLSQGAKASFFIQYNSDGVWHRKGEMTGKGTRTYLFPIVPVRCDHMKIKLAGRGDMKLLSVSKILEEGGDV